MGVKSRSSSLRLRGKVGVITKYCARFYSTLSQERAVEVTWITNVLNSLYRLIVMTKVGSEISRAAKDAGPQTILHGKLSLNKEFLECQLAV